MITSAGALIGGLKAMGARRIAMMVPYTDALTKAVVDMINFGIADNTQSLRPIHVELNRCRGGEAWLDFAGSEKP